MIAATVLVYLAVKHDFRHFVHEPKSRYYGMDCTATDAFFGSTVFISATLHLMVIPATIIIDYLFEQSIYKNIKLQLWVTLTICLLVCYVVVPMLLFFILFLTKYGSGLGSLIKYIAL